MHSVIKHTRRIQSIGIPSTFNSRITYLENNVYKVTYYEIITGATGTITVPTGATINSGEFSGSNCILSEIDGSNKVTWVSPKDAGGTVVTATLNTGTGAWTMSGTPTAANVALIYSINIAASNYQNLNTSFIIEETVIGDLTYVLNNTTKNSVTSLLLKDTMSDETGSGSLVFNTNPVFSGAVTGAASYNGLVITANTGAITTGTWTASSISTSYTDAKIKGAVAASNRIAFGSGVADTLTDSANITYNGTTFAISGYLSVATTSVPFYLNSTNSNINKLQFKDNGTSRGYLGASSTYCFTAYESTGAAMRLGLTSAGNLLVGPTSSGGTDIVGEFLRTVASTAQVRLTNASASNGAYVQYTLINNATVVNLGLVGGGTTTSGVYVQGEAYNMTTSTGYSIGTLNASGVVRIYGGNGTLCFTVDSSSHFNMADAKNIIFNTSTGSKIGTATTQKLAFWNKTPIVQPTTGITGATLTGGGGTTITSTDTFGGYTLQQLAAVIINTGLAA